MKSFEFRADDHTYWLDGVRLPSVTEIIGYDNPYATDYHRDRGSAVHKALVLILAGDLDESTVDPRVAPFLVSFREFLADSGFRPRLKYCEKPMYHKGWKYAGTPDLVGKLGRRPCVIECKTTSLGNADIQCSAYVNLVNQHSAGVMSHGFVRFGLLLKPGQYSLTEFKDPGDFPRFCELLVAKNQKEAL